MMIRWVMRMESWNGNRCVYRYPSLLWLNNIFATTACEACTGLLGRNDSDSSLRHRSCAQQFPPAQTALVPGDWDDVAHRAQIALHCMHCLFDEAFPAPRSPHVSPLLPSCCTTTAIPWISSHARHCVAGKSKHYSYLPARKSNSLAFESFNHDVAVNKQCRSGNGGRCDHTVPGRWMKDSPRYESWTCERKRG